MTTRKKSLVFILLVLALWLPHAPVAQGQSGSAVPNEYIWHFQTGTTRTQAHTAVNAAGGNVQRYLALPGTALVNLSDEAQVEALRNNPATAYLEPNLLRQTALSPDDPSRGQQWALTTIGAESAWDVTTGAGQVIAVLDEGVDLNHPDLAPHLLAGYDYVDGDSFPAPTRSGEIHGSHVTGIANAMTNNGVGIAGIAWNANTMPMRIIGPVGATSADIAEAIVDATDAGADVINLSLAGPGWIKIERDAVNYAAARGVVIVAAAGNENTSTPYYPASYDHVLSVANTTSSDTRSGSSNYGFFVDIAAPGSGIYSTIYDDGYGELSGTSMSAPYVAGTAALVRAAGLATTPTEIAEALLCSTLDLGDAGRDDYYGWGRLRADQAVRYVPGSTTCQPYVANDDFDNAQVITSSSYTSTLDASAATAWEDDPALPCGDVAHHTIWYRFEPPIEQDYTISTNGSTYDTIMGVYFGPRGGLYAVGCNDDSGEHETSALTLSGSPGDVFYIMIAATDHHELGTLAFSIQSWVPSGCNILPGTSTVICATE